MAAGVTHPAWLPAEDDESWATPWVPAKGRGHEHPQQREVAAADRPAQP